MILDRLIAACPDGFDIVVADVGSAGGLKDRWKIARRIVSGLMFEPRDEGAIRREGRDTIYPLGLGPEPGRATLNITALPNMSSTLQPDAALLGRFRKKGTHARIVSTIDMPVDTLDAIAARDALRIDALKVDTQGSELGILQGAGRTLETQAILAEVEVSFFRRYRDQPVAGELIAHMASIGFELLDLYRLKRYRSLNDAGVGNISLGGGQRAGRLAYGDALFFLEEERLLARIAAQPDAEAEMTALRAIVALIVYGKPDMAARLFDETAGRFDPARRQAVARYLAGLRKRHLRSGFAHHMLDYLGRHV